MFRFGVCVQRQQTKSLRTRTLNKEKCGGGDTYQHLHARRLDEHEARTEIGLLQVLHALHLDVEDANLARVLHLLHRPLARAVVVVGEARELDELVFEDAALELLLAHEVILAAILFARTRLARRVCVC